MGTIRPQIVLFGDSITEYGFDAEKRGWGAGLANRHARTVMIHIVSCQADCLGRATLLLTINFASK